MMRMVAVLLCLLLGVESAEAQTRAKPEARRAAALSPAGFREIEAARALMEKEKYADALKVLDEMRASDAFTAHEKAVAQHTRGLVFAAKGDFAGAIAAFEAAVASGDLPPRLTGDLLYNIAQLHLAEGDAAAALAAFEKWAARRKGALPAEARGLSAHIHFALDDLPAAERDVRAALTAAPEPRRDWVQLLLAVLLDGARYDEARPLLEDAAARWPEAKTFWRQLAGVRHALGDETGALAAYEAQAAQGMLESGKELTTLAQLYLYHGIPAKAAAVLEAGFADAALDDTADTHALLADAYMAAREWDKAIVPLTRAAALSETGKFYARLGRVYAQGENWPEAARAYAAALDKGGLEDAGGSWLMLGIARFRTGDAGGAVAAFRKAGDDDALAEDAFRWIRAVERHADRDQANSTTAAGRSSR